MLFSEISNLRDLIQLLASIEELLDLFTIRLPIVTTFYDQLFYMQVLCAAFMCLQFGFVIFWQKEISIKAAHKMLVKLTPCLQKNVTI